MINKVNYIGLINRFWKCNVERPLSPFDTRLYFYLLHTCNQLGWKMPFGHSDRYLAVLTGMSVPTVRDCKMRLQKRGLIQFKIPETKSKSYEGQTQYWFPTVQPSYTDGYTDDLMDAFTDNYAGDLTNNKTNKTKLDYKNNPYNPLLEKRSYQKQNFNIEKTIEGIVNDSPMVNNDANTKRRRKVALKEEKEEIILPFSSEKFTESWNMLLQMPKWKNKQSLSLQLTLKKLAKYDEEFVIQLIELAITSNWQGIIYPDTDIKYEQWKVNNSNDENQATKGKCTAIKGVVVETIQPKRNYKERF